MTTPVVPGSSGVAANAAKRFPSAASRTRSSCETAAPEMGGMGGDESRSKHMPLTLQGRDESLEVLVARPPADRGAHEAASGQLAHDDAGLGQPRHDVDGLLHGHPPRDERRALLGYDDVLAGLAEELPAALCSRGRALGAPARERAESRNEARDRGGRGEVGIEAPRALLRLEGAVDLVALLREIARVADPQRLGIRDHESAHPVRAAEPLLP